VSAKSGRPGHRTTSKAALAGPEILAARMRILLGPRSASLAVLIDFYGSDRSTLDVADFLEGLAYQFFAPTFLFASSGVSPVGPHDKSVFADRGKPVFAPLIIASWRMRGPLASLPSPERIRQTFDV
jgi:hypothetical protein